MSLDIYLEDPTATYEGTLYECNITHNLKPMAKEVGLDFLWDSPPKKAVEMIVRLERGLKELSANPEKYKKFDSPTGWGTYEDFTLFIHELLEFCMRYKESNVLTHK